jgi:hypothetical protein
VPAVLLLTPDPLPEAELPSWLSPDAVLVDSFPVAVLSPVLAVAVPSLETSASWSTITTQPPVPQTFVGSAFWLTVVPESLPVAAPLPVSPLADPPLLLPVPLPEPPLPAGAVVLVVELGVAWLPTGVVVSVGVVVDVGPDVLVVDISPAA